MRLRFLFLATALACAFACGSAERGDFADSDASSDAGAAPSTSIVATKEDASAAKDGGGGKKDGGAPKGDGGASLDAASAEASAEAAAPDGAASTDAAMSDAQPQDSGPSDSAVSSGPITGGPCSSGAAGATALRVKWTNAGGKAQASYEVNGLPDKSRWKTSAYGYQIGFSPSYVDPYLASGGLLLDSSDFIDVELSTVGLSVIRSVTLSLYGRSYATTSSGSFSWQTFDGTGATPSGVVSNAAPYEWTSADATSAFSPGNATALLRIKAGPPSGALVVSRVELCIDAN